MVAKGGPVRCTTVTSHARLPRARATACVTVFMEAQFPLLMPVMLTLRSDIASARATSPCMSIQVSKSQYEQQLEPQMAFQRGAVVKF